MSKRGGYIAPTAVCRTTGRDGCRLFQLPKADCGVDIVAQDRAARLLVAGEHVSTVDSAISGSHSR